MILAASVRCTEAGTASRPRCWPTISASACWRRSPRALPSIGYNGTTISQITSAASVSRRTFYEHFDGKEECFLAAYEALDAYIATVMDEAVKAKTEWSDQVAAALVAVIAFLASRPNFARHLPGGGGRGR